MTSAKAPKAADAIQPVDATGMGLPEDVSPATPYPYLMEGDNEAVRLRVKDRADATSTQLQVTGFAELCNAAHVVDAGTGVGVVAMQMAKLAEVAHRQLTLTLLDGSAQRLAAARDNLRPYRSLAPRLAVCDLGCIPLPSDSVDYLFCRFVFEYLTNPQRVFDEFTRILKPGGKLVIEVSDHNGVNHYPLSHELETQLHELIGAVERSAVFDFYAGRKLYGYFHAAGYQQINVHMYAHHLFYGALDPNDEYNWTMKLDRLVDLQRQNALDVSFDLTEFRTRMLEFLRSPGRFSYTPLILVEGVKA